MLNRKKYLEIFRNEEVTPDIILYIAKHEFLKERWCDYLEELGIDIADVIAKFVTCAQNTDNRVDVLLHEQHG